MVRTTRDGVGIGSELNDDRGKGRVETITRARKVGKGQRPRAREGGILIQSNSHKS